MLDEWRSGGKKDVAMKEGMKKRKRRVKWTGREEGRAYEERNEGGEIKGGREGKTNFEGRNEGKKMGNTGRE